MVYTFRAFTPDQARGGSAYVAGSSRASHGLSLLHIAVSSADRKGLGLARTRRTDGDGELSAAAVEVKASLGDSRSNPRGGVVI